MGKVIYSFCKDGVRYDRLSKDEIVEQSKPTFTVGAIVTKDGHKGKILEMDGEIALVSWEDASESNVSTKDLAYAGRVEN